MLVDPGAQFGDMGGITWLRHVDAGRTTVEELDLQKFRSIQRPGKFFVSIEFDVAGEYEERNQETVSADFQGIRTFWAHKTTQINEYLDVHFHRDKDKEEVFQVLAAVVDFQVLAAVVEFRVLAAVVDSPVVEEVWG